MSNITPEQVVSQDPIHNIPEEIIAQRSAKFRAFVAFLGGVIREEGRGFRAECPACKRDTLHVSPTPENRVGVYCHYCGPSAPRRVLRQNGFDIPAPPPRVINHDAIGQTWAQWRSQGARPLVGTLADTYLRSRAIDIRSFERGTFRHLQCGWGRYEKRVAPVMIGWSYSLFGGDTYKPTTIHVTYLRNDGSGKADVPVPKRTIGPSSGAVIFFVPDAARGKWEREQYWWIVGEGIETVLSYMEIKRRQGERRVAGISALNGAGLQYLSLPKFVRRVIVAADNDANGTGQKFSGIAYWRFLKEGRFARYALPAGAGKDWNDVLRAESGLEVSS
jgi:hypothetical protein